jgi:hypothetical protein
MFWRRSPHFTIYSFICFSSGYVTWFHCHMTNRLSCVRIYSTLLVSYLVKFTVPKGFILGYLLFNIITNDIHDSIYLLFADEFMIHPIICKVDDCIIRPDNNSTQNLNLNNGMKRKIGKTSIISSTRKRNGTDFNYKFCNNLVLHSLCVKDLGIVFYSAPYFYHHINYIFHQGLKVLV